MSEIGLGRQFGWAASGRIGATLLNLAALVVFSRYLGPAEFGRFALGQAAAITGYSVIFYWLVSSITRLSVEQGSRLATFRGAVLLGYFAGGLTLAAAGVLAAGLLQHFDIPDVGQLVPCAVAAAVCEGLYMRSLEHLRAFGRADGYAGLLLLRAMGALVLALLGFHYSELSAEIALSSYAIACLVAAAAGEGLIRERIAFRVHCLTQLREIWNFGYPLSVALIFRVAIQRLDRFLIAGFLGTEAAGLYALAFEFANRALGIPLMIINIVTYPAMVRSWTAGDMERTHALAWTNWVGLLLIGLPSAVGLALVSQDAIFVLFGPQFATGTATIVAAIAGLCMLGEAIKIYHLDLALMLGGDTRDQIGITAAGFLFNAVGCLVLIPYFGIVAAALVALGTVVLLALLSRWRGRRALILPLSIAPVGRITLSCGLMAAAVMALGPAPEALPLATNIAVGILVFSVSAFAFNAGDARHLILELFRRQRTPR